MLAGKPDSRAGRFDWAEVRELLVIVDNAVEAIVTVDSAQCIVRFNKSAEALFGWAAEEVLGQPLDILLPLESRARHRDLVRRFARESVGARFMRERDRVVARRRDGSHIPVEASILKRERHGRVFMTAVLRDARERVAYEEALLRAKRDAEQADRAKSEFLATMSHELRTPLNAIIGFADAMRQECFGPLGSQRYASYAHDIVSSGEHLLSLVDSILQIASGEAKGVELREERVDLADVAAACLRLVDEQAGAQGVRLTQSIAPDLPRLWADPGLLKQILTNLLVNAVKFTPRGGEVDVAAVRGGDGSMIVTVRDTGEGIAESEIDRVLRPFEQGTTRSDRSPNDGVGLGLPLSKMLVERHGGLFRLESQHGRGTTVTMAFPASRVLDRRGEAAPAIDETQ